MDLKTLKNHFENHKERELFGRYISSEYVLPLIKKHGDNFKIETIGASVLGQDIHIIKIGTGPKKILMWSQMHGNESTTTKAIFDMCNVFANSKSKDVQTILSNCTIAIIPMLNPDGGNAYTRVNSNEIDLNRDALQQSQPESKALRKYFEVFQPDFCFNLHGQRTIFSAGNSNHPATVSFLSPAQDEICSVTETRKKAMEIIVQMNKNLQLQIPNQVGVYDDAFNINCVGDTFQSLEVPTVLFEAGHFVNDYDREVVREFIFQSLLVALDYIAVSTVDGTNHQPYFEIPENQKLFFDIIIRNAKFKKGNFDVAVQYYERLKDKKLHFIPIVEKISDLKEYFAHIEVNANGHTLLALDKSEIYIGYENDFVLLNNELFSLKR